jgi:hypothetical protein
MKLCKSLCKSAHTATDKQAVSKPPSPLYIIRTIKSDNHYTRSGMRSPVRQFLATTFPFGFLDRVLGCSGMLIPSLVAYMKWRKLSIRLG